MKHTHFVILFTFLFASILHAQESDMSSSPAPKSKIDKIENKRDVKPESNFYRVGSQAEIVIGEDSLISERYPVYAFFGYSYTQTIYLQSEIGSGDTISKIWYYFNGTSLAYSNNWTIYFGHTAKTVFESNSDWIPVSELTQVYSATFADPGASGWIEFDIDEFVYNGTDNLVIAVDENADDYDGSENRFYCSNVASSGLRSLAAYSDVSNPDPAAPNAANQIQSIIPNIRLLLGSPPAHDLGVTKITPLVAVNGKAVTPKITVHNFGTLSDSTWSVKLTDSLGYEQVVVDLGLIAAGDDFIISFPDWTPVSGIQTLVATVTLLTDEYEDNNILSEECMKIESGYVSIYDDNTGITSTGVLSIPTDQLNPWGESEMIRGLAWKEDTLFAVNAYGDFGIIDTADGSFNIIGATDVICTFYTNLAYDPNTGIIYLLTLSGDYPDFSVELYSIETTTGIGTYINTSSYTGTIAMMAFDNNSNLYAIEHSETGNGYLYSMDEATAELTLIGDLGGVVSSQFQAMAWDFENEVMYFQASTSDLGEMQGSYLLDLTTGNASLVGIPFLGQVMALTIPYDSANNTPKYSVNFNVDMNELITFDYINQEVYLSGGAVGDIGSIGSSTRWAQPGTDSSFLMSDVDEDGIYSLSITGVDTGSYEYKYFWINSGTPAWTNGNPATNKSFSVSAENVELNDVWEVTHVGIENLNSNSEISAYPNPSTGIFTFVVKGEYEANVYDLAGNLVNTYLLKDLNNKIDLTNQQAGMYFIKLIGENTFNLKVIKE